MFTMTRDDQRKRVLPMHFEQVSYLLTNVYGTLKMLITLLLKLDKYTLLPMKIPIFKSFIKVFFLQNFFLQPWPKWIWAFLQKFEKHGIHIFNGNISTTTHAREIN